PKGKIVDTHTLLNYGAGANLIDYCLALKHCFPMKQLPKLLKPQHMDETNSVGRIIRFSAPPTS
ncbi:hypothetical protein PAXRUDRAFT_156525, partial [Paxillus rubicundulus Ve08.2h10]